MQDRWIPAAAVAGLLEVSAAVSGREDFGLRLAEFRRLAHLGPLALVIREEPDVRAVLEMLIRYEHAYNRPPASPRQTAACTSPRKRLVKVFTKR